MTHDEFKQSLLKQMQDAQEAHDEKQFNEFGDQYRHYKPGFNIYRVLRIFGEYQDIFKMLGYDAPGPVSPTQPARFSGDVAYIHFKSNMDLGFTSEIQIRKTTNSDALLLYSRSYRDGKELEPETNMVNHSRNEVVVGDIYAFCRRANIEAGIQRYITGELLRFSPIKYSDIKMF